MPNLYVRTLRSAVESHGETRLAQLLSVPAEALRRWIHGREKIPDEVFLRAAHIVANDILRRRS